MMRNSNILTDKNSTISGFNSCAIIIPSYNELDNLNSLLLKIDGLLPEATRIIVDDSRTEIFQRLKKLIPKNKKTVLIHRGKKSGRGSAVIRGLKTGLLNKKNKHFFEMDADLSHYPEDFIKFIKAYSKSGANVVIGSRYMNKSKVTKWPIYRLIASRIINFCLNLLLGLGLSDYTNGFRMYDRKAAEFLVKKKLREKGFIMLSESAFLLKNNGFSICEIPIRFTDRMHGKSSVGAGEIITSLVGALRIRFTN